MAASFLWVRTRREYIAAHRHRQSSLDAPVEKGVNTEERPPASGNQKTTWGRLNFAMGRRVGGAGVSPLIARVFFFFLRSALLKVIGSFGPDFRGRRENFFSFVFNGDCRPVPASYFMFSCVQHLAAKERFAAFWRIRLSIENLQPCKRNSVSRKMEFRFGPTYYARPDAAQ